MPDDAPEELYTIRNAELFRVGRWNDDQYDEAHLDSMVTAAREAGFGIPLKVGHTDDRGAPAAGWVENVRRAGDKLVADIVGLSKETYAAIKRRAYDAVSCEIYWGLRRGGRVFDRALKAVSLLGAEIPAVSGLTPLHKMLSMTFAPPSDAARVATYTVSVPMVTESPTRREILDEIASEAERLYRTGAAPSVAEATRRLLKIPSIATLYYQN